MRRWLVAVTLLLVLPATQAQPLPETLEGTDPTGDVQGYAPNGAPTGPLAGHDHIDVTGARVAKHSSTELEFVLGVADPEGLWVQDDLNLYYASAALHFVFGGVHYFVEFGQRDEACLRRFVSQDRYDPIDCFPSIIIGGEFSSIIPGTPITDLAGASLRHPAQLSQVWAEGSDRYLPLPDGMGATLVALDRAPDKDDWGALRTPADPGAGPLLLQPVQAVTGSNGAAGVLLFEVLADNVAPQPIDVVFSVTGLPDTWSGLVPAKVKLAPAETRTIPILVTMPFAHQHGSSIPFKLHADVLGVQTVEQELAVRFFDVPQPAGHHDTLYFHSKTYADADNGGWIDTLAEHDLDEQVPFGRWSGSTNYATGQTTDLYIVGTMPDLGIGLDFDLARAGFATFSLQSDLDTEAVASVRVEHCNPQRTDGRDYGEYGGDMRCPGTWIAVLEADERSLALPRGAPTTVDLELRPTAYGDLLPYTPGALLAFVMELTQPTAVAFANAIDILPAGGRIDLPLLEFQPPLSDALAGIGSLRFEGLAMDRAAAPGSRLVHQATLRNVGTQPMVADVAVVGHNAAWVTSTVTRLEIAPGATHAIEAIVRIPSDADPAEFTQVYLVATSQGDDQVVAVLPMRATADGPAIDEGIASAPAKASPTVGTLAVALALLAAAFASRKSGPR